MNRIITAYNFTLLVMSVCMIVMALFIVSSASDLKECQEKLAKCEAPYCDYPPPNQSIEP